MGQSEMHLLLLRNSDPMYLVGHVMCCLYFGRSQERFASLKSQRMIKTESGCLWSAQRVIAEVLGLVKVFVLLLCSVWIRTVLYTVTFKCWKKRKGWTTSSSTSHTKWVRYIERQFSHAVVKCVLNKQASDLKKVPILDTCDPGAQNQS